MKKGKIGLRYEENSEEESSRDAQPEYDQCGMKLRYYYLYD